jgi:hypothetical protein
MGLGQAEQHCVRLRFLLWLSWAVSMWRIMSGRGFVDFFVIFRKLFHRTDDG